jgi:NifU-like protein involved in Fe-S cluster formation
MDGKKIEVVIDPMGNAKVEAFGFQGQGCTDATKAIETALAGGAGQVTREMKPEWHETDDANRQLEQHQQW